MKTLLLALLAFGAPALGATWEPFVEAGVSAPALPPVLAALNVERLNAEPFVAVMNQANVSLDAIQALPAERQAAEIQAQVGRYVQAELSAVPEENLWRKTLTNETVAASFKRFSLLRAVLGAVPESRRAAVLQVQSALWREGARRGLDKLLREPEDWKGKQDPGAVAGSETVGDAHRAATTLARPTPRSTPAPKREPPAPVYDASQPGVSAKVIHGGHEFARTGRGLPELEGSYPDEFLDPKALKGKKVLDLAMGAGTFVQDLRAQGVDAVGVDIYLNPVQARHPEAFRRGSLDKLPAADASADVVYSSWGPFAYDNEKDDVYEGYLKEIARVLKRGGRARLSPFYAWDLAALLRRVPELALAGEETYFRDEGAPYFQREVAWKGRRWTGDPFVELVRR